MKHYSEKIWEEIEELTEGQEQIKQELKQKEKLIEIIEQVESCNTEVKKYISKTNIEKETQKILIEMAKLKSIARKLNNYSFEQYEETYEKYQVIKEKFIQEIQEIKEEYKIITQKLETYEKAYEMGLPIDDEEQLEEITDIELLELIINENLNYYEKSKEEEKQLREKETQLKEKLEELNLSNELKEIILEINVIVNTSPISTQTDELIEYILKMTKEELNEYLDQTLAKCDDNVTFGVLKKLIEKINNPKSIEIIKNIYDKYIKIQKDEYEENIVEHPTIINLIKPTGNGFYIDDDIEIIESIPLVKRVKKQAEELESGNLSGKPIKYMAIKGLLEKKDFKVRTTYKILPNNIVAIINCYIKGSNESMKTKQRTKSVEAQMKLYETLAIGDETEIEKTITFLKTHFGTSKEEIETYKENFKNAIEKEKRRSK